MASHDAAERSRDSRPMDSYLLCTTPRTGSTFLCALLAATGRAGRPASYFRSQDIEARVDEWSIRRADGSFAFDGFVAKALDTARTPNGIAGIRLTRAPSGSPGIPAARTPNGIAGIRLMWGTLDELLEGLRSVGHQGSDREVLGRIFGHLKFVYLRRIDVVAQAVSRCRAEQTGLWHVHDGMTRGAPRVSYDAVAIRRFVDEALDHDRAWNRWFQENGIDPYRVTYEALDRDPDAFARSVLRFLGIDPPAATIAAANVRMADELSRQWVARFRTESDHVEFE